MRTWIRSVERLWRCCKRCTPDGLFTRLLRCGCAYVQDERYAAFAGMQKSGRSVTYNLYAPSLRAGTPCSHAKILSRRMGSWVSIRRIRNIRILGLSGWVKYRCNGSVLNLNMLQVSRAEKHRM